MASRKPGAEPEQLDRRTFVNVSGAGLLSLTLGLTSCGGTEKNSSNSNHPNTSESRPNMTVELWRHATLLLTIGSNQFLIDPMLSEKELMPPIGNAANQDRRIPMVSLPFNEVDLKQRLHMVDAVFITHTHRDHWDERAMGLIPKTLPIFCQPGDEEKIQGKGFTNVTPIMEELTVKGVEVKRTDGEHGTGEIGERMGKVSGFVFDDGTQRLYVAGDTIWCPAVADALRQYQPDTIVVNSGAAQFLVGDPITMSAEDVATTAINASSDAKLIAVHMDTINHCLLTRDALRAALASRQLEGSVIIPQDGEIITCQPVRA